MEYGVLRMSTEQSRSLYDRSQATVNIGSPLARNGFKVSTRSFNNQSKPPITKQNPPLAHPPYPAKKLGSEADSVV